MCVYKEDVMQRANSPDPFFSVFVTPATQRTQPMAVTIESLPGKVYEHLANALEPRDMVMLASTSKTLYRSLFNDQIWKT